MTLYRDIANRIHTKIEEGLYLPGQRLPGVRRLSEQMGVSVSTVVQAQRQLENMGSIEARPRSGYYICERPWLKPELPATSQPVQKPMPVTGQALALQLAQAANQSDFIQFGAAVPDAAFMPMRGIQRSLAKAVREYSNRSVNYAFPPGLPELQQQIGRRMLMAGCKPKQEDILITNGCQEALAIALRIVAKPGDIIAIESPTFYGLLQVIDSLGMKALEIPTDPQHGISLPALEMAFEQWPVKACVVIPNFNNPLGALISDENKQKLVDLGRNHKVVLIEDDIYGELGFSSERPRALRSFAHEDEVIYCSSFSKTISQGLRIGWMVLPPALTEQANYQKYVTNLAAPTLPQIALADYLETGNYERHLRHIQTQYKQQIALFSQAISKYFPPGTRVTQPQGGFVLWVELDEKTDALELTHRAIRRKISIAPGQVFSASQKYRNFIRLNCAQPWSPKLDKALLDLGREVEKLQNE